MALIRPTSYWRKVNPRGAIADFRSVYEQAGANRWRFAVASAAMTIAVFSVMWQEGAVGLPRPPEVTFITSWPADRTDAEIIASNKANQRRKEQLAAEQAARDAEVREMYKALGRASGMDVEAIERRAQAEKAAEQAAQDAARPASAPAAPAPAPEQPAGE